MMRAAELAAVRAGTVDLAFRRWERPRVRTGTRLRTSVGVVEVTSVAEIDPDALTEQDAERAGADSLATLRTGLADHPERPAWRVGLRFGGADPREALRDEVPDAEETARLRAWLDRLDAASSTGPWTRTTLTLIGRHPGRRAPELAATVGRPTAEFKRDVRKLKERGLTQSLDIGYLLSPRGAAVLGDPDVGPAVRAGTPLPKVGAPAARALAAAGLTSLEDVTARTEAEVAALHGVGPFALARLREALAAAGTGFLS